MEGGLFGPAATTVSPLPAPEGEPTPPGLWWTGSEAPDPTDTGVCPLQALQRNLVGAGVHAGSPIPRPGKRAPGAPGSPGARKAQRVATGPTGHRGLLGPYEEEEEEEAVGGSPCEAPGMVGPDLGAQVVLDFEGPAGVMREVPCVPSRSGSPLAEAPPCGVCGQDSTHPPPSEWDVEAGRAAVQSMCPQAIEAVAVAVAVAATEAAPEARLAEAVDVFKVLPTMRQPMEWLGANPWDGVPRDAHPPVGLWHVGAMVVSRSHAGAGALLRGDQLQGPVACLLRLLLESLDRDFRVGTTTNLTTCVALELVVRTGVCGAAAADTPEEHPTAVLVAPQTQRLLLEVATRHAQVGCTVTAYLALKALAAVKPLVRRSRGAWLLDVVTPGGCLPVPGTRVLGTGLGGVPPQVVPEPVLPLGPGALQGMLTRTNILFTCAHLVEAAVRVRVHTSGCTGFLWEPAISSARMAFAVASSLGMAVFTDKVRSGGLVPTLAHSLVRCLQAADATQVCGHNTFTLQAVASLSKATWPWSSIVHPEVVVEFQEAVLGALVARVAQGGPVDDTTVALCQAIPHQPLRNTAVVAALVGVVASPVPARALVMDILGDLLQGDPRGGGGRSPGAPCPVLQARMAALAAGLLPVVQEGLAPGAPPDTTGAAAKLARALVAAPKGADPGGEPVLALVAAMYLGLDRDRPGATMVGTLAAAVVAAMGSTTSPGVLTPGGLRTLAHLTVALATVVAADPTRRAVGLVVATTGAPAALARMVDALRTTGRVLLPDDWGAIKALGAVVGAAAGTDPAAMAMQALGPHPGGVPPGEVCAGCGQGPLMTPAATTPRWVHTPWDTMLHLPCLHAALRCHTDPPPAALGGKTPATAARAILDAAVVLEGLSGSSVTGRAPGAGAVALPGKERVEPAPAPAPGPGGPKPKAGAGAAGRARPKGGAKVAPGRK